MYQIYVNAILLHSKILPFYNIHVEFKIYLAITNKLIFNHLSCKK